MTCKREKCVALGRCATVDADGNSDCFGDARLSGERDDFSINAHWAQQYKDGKRISRDATRRAKQHIRIYG